MPVSLSIARSNGVRRVRRSSNLARIRSTSGTMPWPTSSMT
jgi:hypothetical protein